MLTGDRDCSCQALDRVDKAWLDCGLSLLFRVYHFAALLIFSEQDLDYMPLAGFGGRLDAVNVIDADISVITPIDLDHQVYIRAMPSQLKSRHSSIWAKHVIADLDPPDSLIQQIALEVKAVRPVV